MKWVVVACIPFLVLIGCKTTEEALKESGQKPLTADQIEQAMAGNTLMGDRIEQFHFVLAKGWDTSDRREWP